MNLQSSAFLFCLLGILLLLVIALIVVIFKLNQSNQSKKETETQFQLLENKINSLQLETLQSKLNPHLFKNILNSIQSHAYQTYFALDKLANVLDYILYESRNKFVTPKEEIEFALNLIEINKIKVSPLFELKVKTKMQALSNTIENMCWAKPRPTVFYVKYFALLEPMKKFYNNI